MDQISHKATTLILFFFIFLLAVGNEEKHNIEVEVQGEKKTSAVEMLKTFFTFPIPTTTTSFPESRSRWSMVKTLINRAQAYFFPPGLDFRGIDETEACDGGVGEKMREAVVKSKAAAEDSAKSTAKLAGETVKKTVKKVKESLSDTEREPDAQAEL
ncbi:hypothetical protein F0562_022686 [Nyssa sinensis]|uniref:Uncharacterized protein n=1 Tax=Nyssa sinensis TaxID=561372 RepID=A0A5J5BFL1_9ASTE|nr:hypothetical protein F0562_022686 [Nyssa sinensis]